MKNLGRLYEVRINVAGNKGEGLLARFKDAGTAAWESLKANESGKRIYGENRFHSYVFYPPAVI